MLVQPSCEERFLEGQSVTECRFPSMEARRLRHLSAQGRLTGRVSPTKNDRVEVWPGGFQKT